MARTDRFSLSDSPGRWTTVVFLLLVLLPSVLNAIALLPELSIPVPNLNDDAHHYLFVERASEALANGENPLDHWVPEVEFGVPQFFYYQHVPHLAVVALHRLLLKQVALLTLFNLIRYILLIGFPLTVYWSMRRMGFSTVAGAMAAAVSTLFVSNKGFGLEYGSYTWSGFGMYTQLWGVHLSLITLACLDRLLERGEGHVSAVIASSMLGLSHLVYSYMIAPAALLLLFMGLNRANARVRIARIAVTATLAAVITAYLWLPFIPLKAYLNASVYLPRWRYDSFGASEILTWLVNGDMLDYGRLPVLTLLLALGIVSAIVARTRHARLSLGLLLLWLVLYFGRPTLGKLADLLPMNEGLPFHRFIGGVHLAGLLLIGLGGEWVWLQLAALPERWRAVAAGLILVALMVPALQERQSYYALNKQLMERARNALDADEDARTILSALKRLPPGRTYAGLRANWGKELTFGDLNFFHLLTFHRIVAVSPPYGSISLGSDLIWHFDDRNPAHYNLFNVRYVVAPSGLGMPTFLRPLKETPRYTLYQTETSGYAGFVAVIGQKGVASQSSLFFQNRDWLMSTEPAAGKFVRYDYPAASGWTEDPATAQCPGGGKIREERVLPEQLDLQVECHAASTLVLKMSYHQNWHVTIDGREVRPFMISASFIGLDVPAGMHQIRAEYRSPGYKTGLLLLGAFTLLATIWFRKRFARLDSIFSSTIASAQHRE